MINENTVRKLVEDKLGGTDLFLTDLVVKNYNTIQVFIDGDRSVNIDDCVALSRYIESNLDRDAEDFSLQVSSAGIDHALKFPRQYIKNIGRRLHVEKKDGAIVTGKLLSANVESIQVQTETKRGRKLMPCEDITIHFSEIAKAVCLVSFK